MLNAVCGIVTFVWILALTRAHPVCEWFEKMLSRGAPASRLLLSAFVFYAGTEALMETAGIGLPLGGVASSVVYPLLFIMHEGGHFIWGLTGSEFLGIFGGSLTEFLVPFIFAAITFFHSFYGAASIGFWIAALGLADAVKYIMDAQAMKLSLVYSPEAAFDAQPPPHDWNALLTRLNLLDHHQAVGYAALGLGVILVAAAVVAQVRALSRDGAGVECRDKS